VLRPSHKILLAAAALLFLYLYGLTRTGLLGPDEPRYAAIGREMARSGDWVTPRLWGEAWFEKPALLYWLVAIGSAAGLDADLAPRLPVALFSVAFLVFYFFQVRREFGLRTASYAAAMLTTCAGWVAFSHIAVTDLPLAAAFSASILAALPWVRSGGRRGLLVAGALLGLAVLAKGLVPVVLALPLVWFARRRPLDLLIFGAAALAIAAPWYIACWAVNGDQFVSEFFLRHHFGRFVSDELQHVQPWWFYVPVLLGLLFPWTPLIAALRHVDWREPRQQLLLTTVIFGFVFFSASTNKLPGYVLPVIPLLLVLVAAQLPSLSSRWVLPLCAALLCITPVVSHTLPDALVLGLSRSPIGGFSPWMFAAAVVMAAAAGFLEIRGHRDLALAAVTALAAGSILYLKWDLYPRLDQVASARPVWQRMHGEVYCVEELTRSMRYGVNYYANRALPPCSAQRQRRNEAN
jgi:4-amino-4-deoxy-L-arabinose transferase-like glycosyltransferase